jgi:hypothetical protein
MSRSTKTKRPWRLVYSESFKTKFEALKRELKIMKSLQYIENLIKYAGGSFSGSICNASRISRSDKRSTTF